MKTTNKFKVLRDSREKQGWTFRRSEVCDGMEVKALPTGDYSLFALEDIFTIERKGSTSEIAQNLIDERFTREIERLKAFKYKFILCEFTLNDLLAYPRGSGVPSGKTSMRGPFLLRRICEIMINDGVTFLFAGKKGQELALSLFKRVWEAERENVLQPQTI